jgi:hypothetical protein
MIKPVDMSRINPDALLLHARAAADSLDVPIEAMAHLLPPPDRIIRGRRFWFLATLAHTESNTMTSHDNDKFDNSREDVIPPRTRPGARRTERTEPRRDTGYSATTAPEISHRC